MTAIKYPMDLRRHRRKVYPSEARLRHCTYFAELKLRIIFETEIDKEYSERTFFVPLMLKSDLCLLNGMEERDLLKVKEDLNDPGGYFIVKGKERMIRLITVLKRNYPIACIQSKWKCYGENYTENGILIRSLREEHNISNVSLHFVKDGSIDIRFYYKQYSYHIQVMLILKALVNKSDLSILNEILHLYDNISVKTYVTNMLRILLDKKITSHHDAKTYIGRLFAPIVSPSLHIPYEKVTDLIFRTCILIHLNTEEEKFRFLCFCICKLFALVQNEFKPEDIDNPVFHEILSPGQIYLIALKDSISLFMKSVANVLTRRIGKNNSSRLQKDDLQRCCSRGISITPIIQRMIATGNISGRSYGLPSDTGYTVALGRTNIFTFIAQLTSVCKFSMKHYSKNMRKFYPESWGFLCPAQTPEGENVGLINHLASCCQVVSLNAGQIIPDLLYKVGVLPFCDPATYVSRDIYCVFVDGKIIGWVYDALATSFLLHLKHMKSEAINVPDHTEIIFIAKEYFQFLFPGIYIFSSPCRMVRRVKNLLSQKEELIGCFEQLFTEVSRYTSLKEEHFLSLSPAMIPFGENNPATRNIFSCVKSKQAIGTSFMNLHSRADSKVAQLIYPQMPVVCTKMYYDYSLDEYPFGSNIIIAILSYTGFDMEDAIVLNQASVERGLFNDIVYKTQVYDFEDLAKECYCKISEMEFRRNPIDPFIDQFLDVDGLPYVGMIVRHGYPVISIFCQRTGFWLIKKYEEKKTSYVVSAKFMGVVPSPTLPRENKKVSITYGFRRLPETGDKFINRHGQKGVCGFLMPSEDLPFTADGLIPDVIFNPHGMSSRMSIGMMLEIMTAKLASVKGNRCVLEPFTFSAKSAAVNIFGNYLKEVGLDYYGTQKFYSGASGEELEADIFCGLIYYLRLHHVVEEKYQVRSVGDVDPKTNQPINRGKSGAVRFGEMERDSLISHGTSELLLDRLLYCSDRCEAFICSECQTLLYPVLQHPIPEERFSTLQENVFCRVCNGLHDTFKVQVPYVLVYLIAELSAVGIKVKFYG